MSCFLKNLSKCIELMKNQLDSKGKQDYFSNPAGRYWSSFQHKHNFDAFFRKQDIGSQINVSWFINVSILVLKNKTKMHWFAARILRNFWAWISLFSVLDLETLSPMDLSFFYSENISINPTTFFNDSRNLTFLPFYQHSLAVASVIILAYVLIFLLCMLGNILVCFIVLKNRQMRTVTNIFILNLAISDLLVGILCLPITLVDNLITGKCTSDASG